MTRLAEPPLWQRLCEPFGMAANRHPEGLQGELVHQGLLLS